MTWILLLSSPLLALGGWLWSRRYPPIHGSTLVVGRVAGDEGTLWQAGEPAPSSLELESGGGSTRIPLGDAPIAARWPHRPRIRAGDRIAIEAVAIERSREEAGYRENARGTRLEAARVWIGAPPSRSRWPIALALVPLLLPGFSTRPDPIPLECPGASTPRIVPRPGGGWIGSCAIKLLLHGPWIEIDGNGVRRVEGEHVDGERTGRWIWRAPSGLRLEEGSYRRGLRAGLWSRFHADGRKLSEGRYHDDLQDGLWRFWGPGGEEQQEPFAAGWPMGNRCEPTREVPAGPMSPSIRGHCEVTR